jgi:hypothetical protein
MEAEENLNSSEKVWQEAPEKAYFVGTEGSLTPRSKEAKRRRGVALILNPATNQVKDSLGAEELLIELAASQVLVRNQHLTNDHVAKRLFGMRGVYPNVFGSEVLAVATSKLRSNIEGGGNFTAPRLEVVEIEDSGCCIDKVPEALEHLGPAFGFLQSGIDASDDLNKISLRI